MPVLFSDHLAEHVVALSFAPGSEFIVTFKDDDVSRNITEFAASLFLSGLLEMSARADGESLPPAEQDTVHVALLDVPACQAVYFHPLTADVRSFSIEDIKQGLAVGIHVLLAAAAAADLSFDEFFASPPQPDGV